MLDAAPDAFPAPEEEAVGAELDVELEAEAAPPPTTAEPVAAAPAGTLPELTTSAPIPPDDTARAAAAWIRGLETASCRFLKLDPDVRPSVVGWAKVEESKERARVMERTFILVAMDRSEWAEGRRNMPPTIREWDRSMSVEMPRT